MSEKIDAEKVDLTDSKYADEYNEEKLWGKIKNVAKKAGIKVIYYVLVLFYALQSDSVTVPEKTLIIAALGYFILPLDLIPDFVPIAGYGDDAAVLYGLIQKLDCIDGTVKAQAKSKLKEWFGNYDERNRGTGYRGKNDYFGISGILSGYLLYTQCSAGIGQN